MARAHAIAAIIKDPACQQGLGSHADGLVVVRLFIQLGLDGIEQGAIENRRLFAFEDLTLEGDLSDILCRPPLRDDAAHRNGIIPPGVWNGDERLRWPV